MAADDTEPQDDNVEDEVTDTEESTDEVVDEEAAPQQSWRHRTASGAILSGIALGLQQVFDPEKRNEPAVVQQKSNDHDDDAPFDVALDADDPADTTIRFRPDSD